MLGLRRRLSITGVPLDRQGPLYSRREAQLCWEPEPRIASFGERGGDCVFLDTVEDPVVRPLLVAEIPLYTFNCFAAYYAGGDWKKWDTLMLASIADSIYLVSDEPGKIYCIARWNGLMFLFGRLDPLNVIWDRCNRAFAGLMAQF